MVRNAGFDLESMKVILLIDSLMNKAAEIVKQFCKLRAH